MLPPARRILLLDAARYTLCCLMLVAITTVATAQKGPHPELPVNKPSTVWKVVGGDCDYQVPIHRRALDPDTKEAIEQLKFIANNGTHIHIATSVPQTQVIDELEIELPIRSGRSGLQLMARVVLPRSIDPVTGGPVTVLVAGEMYENLGNWQVLRLNALPLRLDRRVRVLRHSMKIGIDTREAFVDLIVVNAYGGSGVTEVWLQNPLLDGKAERPRLPDQNQIATAGATVKQTQFVDDELGAADESSVPSKVVELAGDQINVEDRPFYARVIDHQGESLEFLTQVGFNVVRLQQPRRSCKLPKQSDSESG